MSFLSAVGAIAISMTMGCAPGRDWRRISSATDFHFRQTHGDVTLVVDPWLGGSDQRKAFGTSLTSHRILPLRIILYNNGEKTIRFSSTQASLVFPNGQLLRTMPKSTVSDRIQNNETVVAMIILIVGGGSDLSKLAAQAVTQGTAQDNWDDQRAIRSASMELVTLDAGQAMSGFLFFNAGKLLKREVRDQTHHLQISRISRNEAPSLSFDVEFTLTKKEHRDDTSTER